MRTASCLTLMAIGAIFTFAVMARLSFLNLPVAGVVMVATGVAGLLLPRRGQQGWLRRRTILCDGPRDPVVKAAAEVIPALPASRLSAGQDSVLVADAPAVASEGCRGTRGGMTCEHLADVSRSGTVRHRAREGPGPGPGWSGSGAGVPLSGSRAAVEERSPDPLVVVEVLDVQQVGRGDGDLRVQVGGAVPGDLEVVRLGQGRPTPEFGDGSALGIKVERPGQVRTAIEQALVQRARRWSTSTSTRTSRRCRGRWNTSRPRISLRRFCGASPQYDHRHHPVPGQDRAAQGVTSALSTRCPIRGRVRAGTAASGRRDQR